MLALAAWVAARELLQQQHRLAAEEKAVAQEEERLRKVLATLTLLGAAG